MDDNKMLLEEAYESATGDDSPMPEQDYSNPPEEDPKRIKYASIKEFAILLGVRENTVEQRIYRGTLKVVRVGRKRYIPLTELSAQKAPSLRTGKKINKMVSLSTDLAKTLFVPEVNASANLEAGGWIMAYAFSLCRYDDVFKAISRVYGGRVIDVIEALGRLAKEGSKLYDIRHGD